MLELDANLLKELDILAFGKRVKIANAIQDLKRPQSSLSIRSPQAAAGGVGSNNFGRGSIGQSPTTGYPQSPSFGYETGGPRSSSAGGVHQSIPEDKVFDADNHRLSNDQYVGLGLSKAQGQQQQHQAQHTPKSSGGTPVSGNFAEWAHSRKSSNSVSLANAPIREEDSRIDEKKASHRPPSVHQSITPDAPSAGMLTPGPTSGNNAAAATVATHQRTTSMHSVSSSRPDSPSTAASGKRSSIDQRGAPMFSHKKSKSVTDSRASGERMSFFAGGIGRNRKPAPRYPS